MAALPDKPFTAAMHISLAGRLRRECFRQEEDHALLKRYLLGLERLEKQAARHMYHPLALPAQSQYMSRTRRVRGPIW